MIYKPKALISGMKLGLKNINLYVAIPTKYFIDGKVGVKYNGNIRRIYIKNAIEGLQTEHDDKFGEGTYTLDYFKWKTRPAKEEPRVDVDKAIKQEIRLADMWKDVARGLK